MSLRVECPPMKNRRNSHFQIQNLPRTTIDRYSMRYVDFVLRNIQLKIRFEEMV